MARPKKTKIEDLARIRNNQRKCRERRRGYIAELEQKVKYYENERVQSSTKPETKAQMLLRKDECLGTLLEPSNINDDPRDQSLTDGLGRPDTDWEETATRTQSPWLVNVEPEGCQGKSIGREASHTFRNTANQPLLHDPSNGTELNQSFAPGPAFSGSAAGIHDARINALTYSSFVSPLYASLDTAGIETMICDRFQPASPLTLWPVLNDEMAREDRSMLCSLAYRLILQLNKRQYDDFEIDIKLRCGFKLGRTQSEGCRVDIEVLFAVLEEISS